MQSELRPHSGGAQQKSLGLKVGVPLHVVIAQARMEKGYTLQEVANLARVNIRQYQKFESGERDIRGCSFSLGLRICQILEIDPFSFQ